MGTQKLTGRTVSMPKGLLLGLTVSLGITIAGSALIAKLVDSGKMQETAIGYGIMVMLLTASFAGAKTAIGKIRRRLLMVSGFSGLIFFGSLLSITAVFFGGQYEAVGVTGALVMAGAMAAALIGNSARPRRKKGRTMRRDCKVVQKIGAR